MKLQIIVVLLVTIGISAGLAQIGEEQLSIIITSEGKAKISQSLFPKSFVSSMDVHIISDKISNLLAIDEENIMLGTTQDDELLKIATLGASFVELKYNADILSYESGVFRLKYDSQIESKVILPPLSKLVSLNTIPIKITDKEYLLPPGDISLSFTIRPVISNEFFVNVGNSEQKIEAITAAKIEEFSANQDKIQFIIKDKAIVLTIIPTTLMSNPNDALLNGEKVDFTQFHKNSTHSWIRIDPHEKGLVKIQDTTEKTEEGGGCLIATATYGSEMAPQVQFLREIRDNQLMNVDSGVSFMTGFNQFYYSFSPYVADMERENPMFKEIVKIGITPLLSSLLVMEHAETDGEILGLGISVILMNIGMYFVFPFIICYQGMKIIRTRGMYQSSLVVISNCNIRSVMKMGLFGLIALFVITVSVPSAFETAYAQSEESESPIRMVLDLTRDNLLESLDSVEEDSTAQTFYDLGQNEYQQALDALASGDEESAAEHAIIAMALYEDSAEVIGEIQESFVLEGFDDIDDDGIPSGITEQFRATNIYEVQEEITELDLEFEELQDLVDSNDVDFDFTEFEDSINAAKEDLASGNPSDAKDQLQSVDDFTEQVFQKINEKIAEEQEEREEEFREELGDKIEDTLEQDLGLDEDTIKQMEATLEILKTGDMEEVFESTSEDSEFVKEVVENEIEEELGEPEVEVDDGTETDGTETDGTETDGTETDGTETDGTETDGTETDGTETDSTETDSTETDGTETDGTETDSTETDGTETDSTETDGTETDSTETDGTETDGTETDGTETDGTETDGTETDGTETDGTETDGTETDDVDSFDTGLGESFDNKGDDYYENSFESSIDDVFEANFDGTFGEIGGKGLLGNSEIKSSEEVVGTTDSSSDEDSSNTEPPTTTDDNVNIGDGDNVDTGCADAVNGNIVMDGGSVTIDCGATLNGNVEATGGSITIDEATIQGNIDIVGADDVTITNSYITGNVDIASSLNVVITGNTIDGSLIDGNGNTGCNVFNNNPDDGNFDCVALTPVDDLYYVATNALTGIDVLGNDGGEAPLSIDSVQDPSDNGGTVVNQLTIVQYTSDTDFSGTDTFTYTMEDNTSSQGVGTVTVIVDDYTEFFNGEEQASFDSGDVGTIGSSDHYVVWNNPIINTNIPMNGGELTLTSGTINGSIEGETNGAKALSINGVTINGGLKIKNADPITITGSTINGSIEIWDSTNITITGNRITGSIVDKDGNNSGCTISGNDIDGSNGLSSCAPAPNNPPTADAGSPQSADEGTVGVTLDGTASSDSDGTVDTWAWNQTTGTTVTLSDTTASQPTFTAPSSGAETLTFSLIVTDDDGDPSTADTVNITITVPGVNSLPTADAGPDQIVTEGTTVDLDGVDSFDTDGSIASYAWVRTDSNGQSITLNGANTQTPSFLSPSPGSLKTYVFELIVTDNEGGASSTADTVSITTGAPGASPDLEIEDGYDEKNDKTLDEDSLTHFVETSNNERIETINGFYHDYYFETTTLPAGAIITSVTIYVEDYQEKGFTGNVEWSASGNTIQLTTSTTPSLNVEDDDSTNEAVGTWILPAGSVTSQQNVNDLTLRIENNDTSKKTFTDYAYAVVEWIS